MKNERRTVPVSAETHAVLGELVAAMKEQVCQTTQSEVIEAIILNASSKDAKLVKTIQEMRKQKLAVREQRKLLKKLTPEQLAKALAHIDE